MLGAHRDEVAAEYDRAIDAHDAEVRQAALAGVWALHAMAMSSGGEPDYCDYCGEEYPCRTVQAMWCSAECVCSVGVQECHEHSGNLYVQEEKIAFRVGHECQLRY